MSAKSNKTELSEEFIVMWREEQLQEVFCKTGVLRNFAQEHIPVQSLFFNKVAGLVKFLRTPFLTEHLRVTAFFMFLTVHIYNDMKIKLTKRN